MVSESLQAEDLICFYKSSTGKAPLSVAAFASIA
jgi:hypothetical protein